jgi:hypothetical protein
MEHHLRARARAAGLDEAQVPRRDVRLQRKLELSEPSAPAPLSQHRTDRRPTGSDHHVSIVNRLLAYAITSEVIDTANTALHPGQEDPSRKEPHLTEVTHMVQRHLDTWDGVDPDRRRDVLATVWAEDVSYVDRGRASAPTLHRPTRVRGGTRPVVSTAAARNLPGREDLALPRPGRVSGRRALSVSLRRA